MADVDVMDLSTMKRMWVVDFEDVGDVDEDESMVFDENNGQTWELSDFHDWNEHYSVTVRNDWAYLSKNDIWGPLYLCLSTQKRAV